MTITAFELSFQFPINRDGASPVVGAASVAAGVSAGAGASVAASLGAGSADCVTAGTGAGASSFSFLELPITMTPTRRIPTRTAKRTLEDEPLLDEVVGALAGFAADATRGALGAGVVETFTREVPVRGTGGMTTLDAEDFLAEDFLTLFLAVFFAAFLTVAFLAVVFFFAAVFFTTLFAVDFFAADFLTVFFAADFFAGDFFAVFLAVVFFFTATWISLSH
jgi:hypothetical protein